MDPTGDGPSSSRAADPSRATANRPSQPCSGDVQVRKESSKGLEQLERHEDAAPPAAREPAEAEDGGSRGKATAQVRVGGRKRSAEGQCNYVTHTGPQLFVLDRQQSGHEDAKGVAPLDYFCGVPKATGDALLEPAPLGPGSIVFLARHGDAFFEELKGKGSLHRRRPAPGGQEPPGQLAPGKKRNRGKGGSASGNGVGGNKRLRGGDAAEKDDDNGAREGLMRKTACVSEGEEGDQEEEEDQEEEDANVKGKSGSDGGKLEVGDGEDGTSETEEEDKRVDSVLQEGMPKPSELCNSGSAGRWKRLYGKRPVVTAVARVKRVSEDKQRCMEVFGVVSILCGDDNYHYFVELEEVVKVALPWLQLAHDLGLMAKTGIPKSLTQGTRRHSEQSLAKKYHPAFRHYHDTAHQLLEEAKQHRATHGTRMPMDRALDFPPHPGGGYQAFMQQYPGGKESWRKDHPRQKRAEQEKQPPGAQEAAGGDAAGPSVPATGAARAKVAAASSVKAAAEGAGDKGAAGGKLKARKRDDGEGPEATPPKVKRRVFSARRCCPRAWYGWYERSVERARGNEAGGSHGRNPDDAPQVDDEPPATGSGGGVGNAGGAAAQLGLEAATHRSQPAAQSGMAPGPSSPTGVITSPLGRAGPPDMEGGGGRLKLEDGGDLGVGLKWIAVPGGYHGAAACGRIEVMDLTAESEEEEEEEMEEEAVAAAAAEEEEGPAAGCRPGSGGETVSPLTEGAADAARRNAAEAAEPGQEIVQGAAAEGVLAAAGSTAMEGCALRGTTARCGTVGCRGAHAAVIATAVAADAIGIAVNGDPVDAGTNATVDYRRCAMSTCGGVAGGGGSGSEGGKSSSSTHSDGSADDGGGNEGVSGSGSGAAAGDGDRDVALGDEAASGGEGARGGDGVTGGGSRGGVAGAATTVLRGGGEGADGRGDGGSGREQLEPAGGGGGVRRANGNATAAVPANGVGTIVGANAAVPHSSSSGGEWALESELDRPAAIRLASGNVDRLLGLLCSGDVSEDVATSDRTARRRRGAQGGSYCESGGAGAAPPGCSTARDGAGCVGDEEDEEDEEGTAAAAGDAADGAGSFASGHVGADSKRRDGLGQEPVPGPLADPVPDPAPDLEEGPLGTEPPLRSPVPRGPGACHLMEDTGAAAAMASMPPDPAPLALSTANATAGATAGAASADDVYGNRGATGGGIHGDQREGARSTPTNGGGGCELYRPAEGPAVQGSDVIGLGAGTRAGEGRNRCLSVLPPLPLSVSPSHPLPWQPLVVMPLPKSQPPAEGCCGQAPEVHTTAAPTGGRKALEDPDDGVQRPPPLTDMADDGDGDDDEGSIRRGGKEPCRLRRKGVPHGVCGGGRMLCIEPVITVHVATSDADASTGAGTPGGAAGDHRGAASNGMAPRRGDPSAVNPPPPSAEVDPQPPVDAASAVQALLRSNDPAVLVLFGPILEVLRATDRELQVARAVANDKAAACAALEDALGQERQLREAEAARRADLEVALTRKEEEHAALQRKLAVLRDLLQD